MVSGFFKWEIVKGQKEKKKVMRTQKEDRNRREEKREMKTKIKHS